MNPFNTEAADDINHLFDTMATDILINDKSSKAIITNLAVGETEDKYLHTLEKVSQGNKITYQDESYLIITETTTKRHNKYKSQIRHCNYNLNVPVIVENKTFSIDDGHAIRVSDNEIIVMMQDNESNRKAYKKNKIFELMHNNWKVIHHDYTRKGLIIMTCERTASEVN